MHRRYCKRRRRKKKHKSTISSHVLVSAPVLDELVLSDHGRSAWLQRLGPPRPELAPTGAGRGREGVAHEGVRAVLREVVVSQAVAQAVRGLVVQQLLLVVQLRGDSCRVVDDIYVSVEMWSWWW